MHKFYHTILSLLLLFSVCNQALATDSKQQDKRETKKTLKQQRDSLLRIIDSLKRITEEPPIEIADSTDFEADSINTSTFYYLDNEDYNNIEPGCNSDSLLQMWYEHRGSKMKESIGLDNYIMANIDNAPITSNIPDEVYIENLKKMNSFIPIPYNEIVRKYIILYTEKLNKSMESIIGLSNYYLPIFEEIFDSYGLPKEIKALAIIESALNPVAVSRANAKGIWQFMYRTGLQYDLKINSFVDERLDPIAATHAAAKYLRDAYIIFGDWALAISSYNCGSGNVNKAIRRADGSKNFWDIYPYLPRETRGYVPAFIGALYALHYYKDYKIVPQPCPIPSHLDTFKVRNNLHFQQIVECIKIPIEELRYYNPQYINDIIPGNEGEQTLRLPYNFTNAYVDVEDTVHKYKDSLYFNPIIYNNIKNSGIIATANKYHKVRSGDNLSKIAQKYNSRVSDIQKWNKLTSKSIIRPGQKLLVKKGTTTYIADTNTSADGLSGTSKVTTSTSKGYVYYTIKKGDTLLGISHKFKGVSLNDILKLNGFTKNTKIYPGRKIKIKRA